MSKKEIIVGVTGSIASYKACDIINRLRRAGCNTTVVMTKEAKEFVTPLLLQQLSANKVYSDLFDISESWDPKHVSLAQKADLVLIVPATANIIAKLANGICDDLLSCTVIAASSPILIAPAMNCDMWAHRATQENIKKLKLFGYKIIGPVKGRLSCGINGAGHIADGDEIVKEVELSLREGAKRRRSNLPARRLLRLTSFGSQ
jgi:phosphopantothenoylcysteine decarboxylase/phosphopantothenate--cysteine ligase